MYSLLRFICVEEIQVREHMEGEARARLTLTTLLPLHVVLEPEPATKDASQRRGQADGLGRAHKHVDILEALRLEREWETDGGEGWAVGEGSSAECYTAGHDCVLRCVGGEATGGAALPLAVALLLHVVARHDRALEILGHGPSSQTIGDGGGVAAGAQVRHCGHVDATASVQW